MQRKHCIVETEKTEAVKKSKRRGEGKDVVTCIKAISVLKNQHVSDSAEKQDKCDSTTNVKVHTRKRWGLGSRGHQKEGNPTARCEGPPTSGAIRRRYSIVWRVVPVLCANERSTQPWILRQAAQWKTQRGWMGDDSNRKWLVPTFYLEPCERPWKTLGPLDAGE